MTNQEMRRLALRKGLGFGPEVMKETKVCRVCRCTCEAAEKYCRECGAFLPRETLFDLYKSYHLYCPVCDTIVSSRARFCPACGRSLRKRWPDFGSRTLRKKEDTHGKA